MFRYAIISALCCFVQLQADDIPPRIIIIGSGPSGIAAGTRLLENGFENVTILEAENRVGGRLYSKEFGGHTVDIGAQWVHGEKNNAVFEMVWPLGLVERSNPVRYTSIYDSEGVKMNDNAASDLIEHYIGLTSMSVTDEYKDGTLGAWYTHKLDEYFEEHPEIKAEQREPLKKSLCLMEMALDAADSWFDVAVDKDYEECEGDQMINWKNKTYGSVIDILTKKFPNPAEELPFRAKTILNTEVTKINYNNPDGAVRVVTKNGDEYVADHVIFTPSLGVLKADHEKLFNPPLPELKANAIKTLGFGSVAKIYLKYDEPWWPMKESVMGMHFYWTDEDRKKLANDAEKSWFLGVYAIITVEHKPGLLCCWVTGQHAREMEAVSEDKVLAGVKELIHKFVGKSYNITEPTAMLRSRWFSDPHFRGTYSHRTPESKGVDSPRAQIAEPIMGQEKPRVMFAGEATSTHQYSTVHGAISTGWREADRLMKQYGHEVTEKPKTSLFYKHLFVYGDINNMEWGHLSLPVQMQSCDKHYDITTLDKFHQLHLKKMFSCAIILALSCFLQLQADQASPRIIIIGSGASGIAAGTRLLENGFGNVTILEAEDRIGGRLYSTEFAGYPIDIGGQWVHGEKDNAVFEMAWPLGVLEKSDPQRDTTMFDSAGEKMEDRAVNDLIDFVWGNLSSMAVTEEYRNRSVGDWYSHKLDEYFEGHPEIKPEQREPLKKSLCSMEMASDGADSWFDVSTDEEYEQCEGDQAINWKEKTYGFVIDLLTKKFPNPAEELPFRAKTIINTEVTKINYNNPDGAIRVVTKNGDEYVADHVIFTPSLGVLKADHEKLFNPPLPESKVDAIKAIGYGSVAKIYLKYEEPWWLPTDHVMGKIFHWTDDHRKKMASDPVVSWLLGVYSIISVEHKPGLLCCWVTGQQARDMERVPEEQVFNGVKELIHRFLGKSYNLTEPTAMLRSRWFSNPHFRGTYSYRTPESQRAGIVASQIAEPIMELEKPRVMFAGEATSSHQYSTVHGAITSGWREADRILKHYGHDEVTKKPKAS
ncbi:uncharacterized protein [Venturia canescens]|uniref:uncharacterized protein n=1 Tax=Venturia canescens TaxID=32260 RepID=UPI001C9C7A4C|nr:uncharacterized protein LOC122405698 [Venturia canescens]